MPTTETVFVSVKSLPPQPLGLEFWIPMLVAFISLGVSAWLWAKGWPRQRAIQQELIRTNVTLQACESAAHSLRTFADLMLGLEIALSGLSDMWADAELNEREALYRRYERKYMEFIEASNAEAYWHWTLLRHPVVFRSLSQAGSDVNDEDVALADYLSDLDETLEAHVADPEDIPLSAALERIVETYRYVRQIRQVLLHLEAAINTEMECRVFDVHPDSVHVQPTDGVRIIRGTNGVWELHGVVRPRYAPDRTVVN